MKKTVQWNWVLVAVLLIVSFACFIIARTETIFFFPGFVSFATSFWVIKKIK